MEITNKYYQKRKRQRKEARERCQNLSEEEKGKRQNKVLRKIPKFY